MNLSIEDAEREGALGIRGIGRGRGIRILGKPKPSARIIKLMIIMKECVIISIVGNKDNWLTKQFVNIFLHIKHDV